MLQQITRVINQSILISSFHKINELRVDIIYKIQQFLSELSEISQNVKNELEAGFPDNSEVVSFG